MSGQVDIFQYVFSNQTKRALLDSADEYGKKYINKIILLFLEPYKPKRVEMYIYRKYKYFLSNIH